MTVTETPNVETLKPDERLEETSSFTVGPSSTDEATRAISSTEDQDWERFAACRIEPGATEVFFSEELSGIIEAKRICASCQVIAPCLEGAIARAEPCGVWGGQLFSDGRILTQKRRRGRPPKVARPEDQLPVVPVPAHLQKLIA